MSRPHDAEIEALVERLEIGWLQARRHLVQRSALRERLDDERRHAIAEGIRNLA